MATLKFGKNALKASTATVVEDKPKSQLWVNVGYTQVVNGVDVFVSVPMGIPLESVKELVTNTRNVEFNQLNQARNQLLADILAASEDLEPGQDHTLELEVQVRRIDKEADPLPAGSVNPFLRTPKP